MIIIDAEGAEQPWQWVVDKYNLPDITRAPKEFDHWEVVELREVIGPSSMTVRVIPSMHDEVDMAAIIFGWPDGDVMQRVGTNSQTGFGMGGGAYYRPDRGEQGPHYVRVLGNSDIVKGLGMIGKTNHAHLEPTFQFVKAEEPEDECKRCEQLLGVLGDIESLILPYVMERTKMWMDDVDMAKDAYGVWLRTKFDCEYDSEGCEARSVTVLQEALEAFDTIFGEEDTERPEDSQPNTDTGGYIYDPVAKIRWMKTPQDSPFPISEEEWRKMVAWVRHMKSVAERGVDLAPDDRAEIMFDAEVMAYDDVLEHFRWWEHERLEEDVDGIHNAP